MPAIITDQIRVLNASNFVSGISTTDSSYYVFIGLPNATDVEADWNTNTPAPIDNFDDHDDIYDTLISAKKIAAADTLRVIRKISWTTGTIYEMYRHDYDINNPSPQTNSSSLYQTNYYVMNSDFRVYECISNGADPSNSGKGIASLEEPTHTDLQPRLESDGYVWKYLFTIKPTELIKFDSTSFVPVPNNWETLSDVAAVRNNADTSGQLKIVTIKDRGVGYGTATTYNNVPIKGDGEGATCSVVVNAAGKINSVEVTNGGSDYSFGSVDLNAVGLTNPSGSTDAAFNVIIPPQGGHGSDVYRELGANRVLIYSRLENDITNPDFITGNQFARIGIVKNPDSFGSSNRLTLSRASATYALKLIGAGSTQTSFSADDQITQTIGIGSTAVGRTISWDSTTGVLKYWQDRSLVGFTTAGIGITNPTYGYQQKEFTASPDTGGSLTIIPSSGSNLAIDTSFTGISTVINNRTYYLGQSFTNGVSGPEVKKHAGNIIYVDNRPAITRSVNQKEDIKIILQF